MTTFASNTHYNAPIPYNGLDDDSGLYGRCDPFGRIIEFDLYIAPDGTEYLLHSPPIRAVISLEGDGIAPINYISQHGPYQHGVTVTDYFLTPRTIQVVLRVNARSRTDWYWARNLLVSALRPNRTPGGGQPQPGTLRRYMPNGKWIDLKVFCQKGPGFAARNLSNWDEWSIQETFQFYAADPIYFNPVQHSQQFATPIRQLVFPIVFPIVFDGLDVTDDIYYYGDWPEFPTITLTGPINKPTIVNNSTGEKLALNYNLASGRQITYTLTYELKQVLLDDGTSLAPYLTSDSDIATFHLAPDPEIEQGINNIHVFGSGAESGSLVSFAWYDRYVALEIFD